MAVTLSPSGLTLGSTTVADWDDTKQTEHFIFSESTGSTYPYYIGMKRGFTQSGIASSPSGLIERGGINGSGLFPDGKTSIVAVSGTGNPGGTFFDIFTLGNESAGNSGFTTLTFSNEDGTVTGSVSRANMSYFSQTPSVNSRWSRRWLVSQNTSYTGTHPKNIIDDGYIKITFS